MLHRFKLAGFSKWWVYVQTCKTTQAAVKKAVAAVINRNLRRGFLRWREEYEELTRQRKSLYK